MNRRNLIKNGLLFSVLSALNIKTKWNPPLSSKLEVIFKLPENMTFDEYERTVPTWVDFQKFKSILARYKSDGSLYSATKTFGSRTVRTIYYFTDEEMALQFCEETMKSCGYNFAVRNHLGIEAKTFINGSLKEFGIAGSLDVTLKS